MKQYEINYVLGSIVSLLILILQGSVMAQDEFSEEDPFTDDEESVLFDDIPSVYSASKYDQKVTKAPSSISIVTADEIKKYGYRNLWRHPGQSQGILQYQRSQLWLCRRPRLWSAVGLQHPIVIAHRRAPFQR